MKKRRDYGGKVVTLSGPDGYIYDPEGVLSDEKLNFLLEMRSSGRDKVQDYADKFGVEFFPGQKPWRVNVYSYSEHTLDFQEPYHMVVRFFFIL